MEFTIKMLVVIVLAFIVLLSIIFIISKSGETGVSLIDSLKNFFKDIIPGGENDKDINVPEITENLPFEKGE